MTKLVVNGSYISLCVETISEDDRNYLIYKLIVNDSFLIEKSVNDKILQVLHKLNKHILSKCYLIDECTIYTNQETIASYCTKINEVLEAEKIQSKVKVNKSFTWIQSHDEIIDNNSILLCDDGVVRLHPTLRHLPAYNDYIH